MDNGNENYDEVYFSCDVESDGPIPGRFSMVSFALIATGARRSDGVYVDFDVDDPDLCFYVELQPVAPESDPEALAISGLTLDHLRRTGLDPKNAMGAAHDFTTSTARRFGTGKRKPVFLAYPLPFDWTFMYYYFMTFHGTSPFSFSNALDLKTAGSLLLDEPVTHINKRALNQFRPKGHPHTHNALDDAREQGLMGMTILKRLSGQEYDLVRP